MTWLVGNRIKQLKEFVAGLSGWKCSIGYASANEASEIFTGHLRFFKSCGVYPVWMIDEFESVSGLKGHHQQDHLGMYRDIIDAIYRESWGAVMLYSTPDGVKTILTYPALYDRLQGPSEFLISSPTWRTEHFGRWRAESVIKACRELYIGAAAEGDYVGNRVINNMGELDSKLFLSFINELSEAVNVVPRLRLKEIIFTIDRLAQGVDDFTNALVSTSEEVEEVTTTEDLDDEFTPPDTLTESEDDDLDNRDNLDNLDNLDSLDDPDPFKLDFDLGSYLEKTEPSFASNKDIDTSILDPGFDPEPETDPDPQPHYVADLYYRARRTDLSLAELSSRIKSVIKHSPHTLAAYLSAYRDKGESVDQLMEECGKLKGFTLIAKLDSPYDTLEDILEHRQQNSIFDWAFDLSPSNPVFDEPDSESEDQYNEILAKTAKRVPNPDYPLAVLEKAEQAERKIEAQKAAELGDITADEAKTLSEQAIQLPREYKTVMTPTIINPFSSIGQLRHFAYTIMATNGYIASDAQVDKFTLKIARKLFGYKPRTSRNGIGFTGSVTGVRRLWSRPTFYADELIDTNE